MMTPRAITRIIVTLFVSIEITECITKDISVQVGDSISMELPSFIQCGQYILLDPSLELVFIVSGTNSTNTFGSYIARSRLVPTISGFLLTITSATKDDEGLYKLAVSTQPGCSDVAFDVIVHTGADEYLLQWSAWSDCIMDCDPGSYRYRQRNCSVSGGCVGLGELEQEDTCDRAEHCPHWTEWGQYGPCSAKCGKGFKIRKRICIDRTDTLRENSACFGHSTENNMCMVICDVVGVWSNWSEWGNCTGPCPTGTRIRTRDCGGDPRTTLSDCPGTGNESEPCVPVHCSVSPTSSRPAITPSSTNTSAIHPAYITISNDVTLNYYVLIGMGCTVLIILVVIIVCVTKKRNMRRSSRPDIQAVATIQNSPKTDKAGGLPKSGSRPNVYSEMNHSSTCDNNDVTLNVRDPNDPERSPRLPTTSMILRDLESEILNGSYTSDDIDSDFDTVDDSIRSSQCDRQEMFVTLPDKRAFSITSQTAIPLDLVNGGQRRGSSLRRPSDVMRAKKNVQFNDNLGFENETTDTSKAGLETVSEASTQDAVNAVVVNQIVAQEKLKEALADRAVTIKLNALSDCELKRISKDIEEVMGNIGYPIEEAIYENAEVFKLGCKQSSNDNKSGKVLIKQECFYNTPVIALCNCPRDAKPPSHKSSEADDPRTIKEKEAMQQQQQQNQQQQQQQQHFDFSGDNTYYNGKVSSDITDFYVTPRRKRSLRFFKKNSDEEPIYDVPKSPEA